MISIKEIRKPGRISILAVDSNKTGQKIVGYAKIWTEVQKDYDWLVAYYIRPRYRGTGLARQIMDKVKSATNKNIALRVNPYKDQEGADPEDLAQKYMHFGFRKLPNQSQNNMYFIKKKSPETLSSKI